MDKLFLLPRNGLLVRFWKFPAHEISNILELHMVAHFIKKKCQNYLRNQICDTKITLNRAKKLSPDR